MANQAASKPQPSSCHRLFSSNARAGLNNGSMRELVSAGMVVAVAALIATWLSIESRAQTKPSIIGAWTLNKDLSDQPPERGDQSGDSGRRRSGGSGGGFGRGGGSGRGSRMGRGGGSGGGAHMDPEAMARM